MKGVFKMAKKKTSRGPQERFDKALFVDAKEATEMENIWQEGQEAANMPIGSFQVDIASAVLERSQSSERLQIHYELVILAGNFKDVKLDKYDGLATPVQTRITQSQLKALGVNVKKVTVHTLPAILLSLVHQKAAVKTKQSGPYYNINFQKLIVGAPKSVSSRGPTTKKRVKRSSSSADRSF